MSIQLIIINEYIDTDQKSREFL